MMQPQRRDDGDPEKLRLNANLTMLRMKVAAQRLRDVVRLDLR